MEKFTQEVKDNWLKALKSGEYKQGTSQLVTKTPEGEKHCCLGVLGVIHPKLSVGNGHTVKDNYKDPYSFIDNNFPQEEEKSKMSAKIWRINDRGICPGDYSNVIPFIEELEVANEE